MALHLHEMSSTAQERAHFTWQCLRERDHSVTEDGGCYSRVFVSLKVLTIAWATCPPILYEPVECCHDKAERELSQTALSSEQQKMSSMVIFLNSLECFYTHWGRHSVCWLLSLVLSLLLPLQSLLPFPPSTPTATHNNKLRWVVPGGTSGGCEVMAGGSVTSGARGVLAGPMDVMLGSRGEDVEALTDPSIIPTIRSNWGLTIWAVVLCMLGSHIPQYTAWSSSVLHNAPSSESTWCRVIDQTALAGYWRQTPWKEGWGLVRDGSSIVTSKNLFLIWMWGHRRPLRKAGSSLAVSSVALNCSSLRADRQPLYY